MTSYPNDELAQFFSKTLAETDPALKASIDDELGRQQHQRSEERRVGKECRSRRRLHGNDRACGGLFDVEGVTRNDPAAHKTESAATWN